MIWRITTLLSREDHWIVLWSYLKKRNEEMINISIGIKDLKEIWLKAFTQEFLKNFGWKFYRLDTLPTPLNPHVEYLATVQTKHGELVVHDGDSITYLGHNLWDVRKG